MGTGKGTVDVKLDLSGMKPGQQAGFVRFSVDYHLCGVRVADTGQKRLFFNMNGQLLDGPVIEADTLWIRSENDGPKARFAWSFLDGSTRRYDRSPGFTVRFGKWCGDRLGFFCWNEKRAEGHVDIDYFHYDYDGPKAPAR
jgi:hypothetical protein